MAIIDNDSILSGIILEVVLLLAIVLIFYAIFGKKKQGTYSWEKKSGALVWPLIVSLVLLIGVMVYVVMIFFSGAVWGF